MRRDPLYETEVARVIDERIAQLRSLSLDEVAVLPEATEEEIVLGNTRCSLNVFRQDNLHNFPNAVLVTVLVARKGFLGLVSYHTERGVVFSRDGLVREASALELQNSGG